MANPLDCKGIQGGSAMNEYADSVKEKLENVLNEIHGYSRPFVKNPMKDFTRKHKLDFKDMLTFNGENNHVTLLISSASLWYKRFILRIF